MSALEVVVGQDGAAHDGQIGVGTYEVVGELPHKVQQLGETGPVNLHGHMLAVQANAVLVVVDIGGVLQKPGGAVNGDGDNAMILPGRVVDPACVPLVLGAQLAPGVGGSRKIPGCGDGFGVLLWFGEIDGNVQFPILGGGLPLHVAGDAVPADVVGVLAEGVVPVGGRLGGVVVHGLKLLNDIGGAGREAAHQLGVEQVAVNNGIFRQHTPGMGVVQQLLQDGGQLDGLLVPGVLRFCITIQF